MPCARAFSTCKIPFTHLGHFSALLCQGEESPLNDKRFQVTPMLTHAQACGIRRPRRVNTVGSRGPRVLLPGGVLLDGSVSEEPAWADDLGCDTTNPKHGPGGCRTSAVLGSDPGSKRRRVGLSPRADRGACQRSSGCASEGRCPRASARARSAGHSQPRGSTWPRVTSTDIVFANRESKRRGRRLSLPATITLD